MKHNPKVPRKHKRSERVTPPNGHKPRTSQVEIEEPISISLAYETDAGRMFHGAAERWLASPFAEIYRGKIQLVLTSPPFPLNRKKKYGNKQGDSYLQWLSAFAPLLRDMLTPNGSIVIELGNAWEPGEPVMSTLALQALLQFHSEGNLKLCQQFICYNPARLPSPAQWVNVERIRVKDAFTNVWWMSKSSRPYADNTQVLTPYSDSMRKLLKTRKYNAGLRPSEHNIGTASFFKDNSGAIPSNVLTYTNTASNDEYLAYCRANDLEAHPARMPTGLAEFFIKFLTRKDDLVLDPFGGSNTTGAAAEKLGRRWVAMEPKSDYIEASRGRFSSLRAQPNRRLKVKAE